MRGSFSRISIPRVKFPPKPHTKSYESHNLTAIPSINSTELVTELRISNNPISNFQGLTTIKTLTHLRCENTGITSFIYANPQPSLQVLQFKNSPISRYAHYQIMALIVFGVQIQTIDGHSVTPEDRKIAKNCKNFRDDLVKGWIILSLNPPKLYNPLTRKRRNTYANKIKIEDPEAPPEYIPAPYQTGGRPATIPLQKEFFNKFDFYLSFDFLESSCSFALFSCGYRQPYIREHDNNSNKMFMSYLTDYSELTPDSGIALLPLRNGFQENLFKYNVLIGQNIVSCSPDVIISDVINKASAFLNDSFGKRLCGVLVSIPPFFTEDQNQLIKKKCDLNKRELLEITQQPLGGILKAISLQSSRNRIALILTYSDSYIQASLYRLNENTIIKLGSTVNRSLGGTEIVFKLTWYFANRFQETTHVDLYESAQAMRTLQEECKKVESMLFLQRAATIRCQSIYKNQTLNETITQQDFNNLFEDKFLKFMTQIADLLMNSRINKNEVTDIIYDGKSAHMQRIKEMFVTIFQNNVRTIILKSKEFIFYGTPGDAIEEDDPSLKFKANIPLSIGYIDLNGEGKFVIPKDSKIPIHVEITVQDLPVMKNDCELSFFQGERLLGSENYSLGSMVLENVKTDGSICEVQLTFDIDQKGDLKIIAKDANSPSTNKLQIVEGSRRVPKTSVIAMMQATEQNKASDLAFLEVARVKFNCTLLCTNIRNAVDNPKNKFSITQKYGITQIARTLQIWLWSHSDESKEVYEAKIEEIKSKLPKNFVF